MSNKVPANLSDELELFLLGDGCEVSHNDQKGHQ